MEQVLDVKNRLVEFPNRYRLNAVIGQENTFDLESINGEIVESGTPFNRGLMNKIDCIMSYANVDGEYDADTGIMSYNIPYLNTSDLIDNSRLLIYCHKEALAPATDIQVIKNNINVGAWMYYTNIIELKNGNIMITGNRSGQSYPLFLTIINKQGTIIKDRTAIASYNYHNHQSMLLDNGNVLIIGNADSNYALYATIVSQDGEIVKSSALYFNNYVNPKMIKLSNGNICIVGSNEDNYDCYYWICNQELQGLYGGSTRIGDKMKDANLIELPNNNILIIGTIGNSNGNYCIISNTGQIVVNETSMISGCWQPQMITLNNGNIMVVGKSGSYGYMYILNQNGQIIKSATQLGTAYDQYRFIELDNHNIMLLHANNGTNSYIDIYDVDGNIVKSQTSISGNQNSPRFIKMGNGNIFIIGQNNGSIYWTIIEQNGNIIKSSSSTGWSGYNDCLLELSNRDIVISGAVSSSEQAGAVIIKPISNSISVQINDIEVDTAIVEKKYYELVYNATLNKFIAQEVRNAN